MSYDPYHQYNPQQQYPAPPPQVVYVQPASSKAATVGIWVIVLWIVGPALLLVLCCAGCMFTGIAGSFMEGVNGGVSPSPTP
ncbi:hypothetical protein [Micromonospora haikouensis]|uniref:hypothetical protein n=1 Tax=Micromonospora haikouensis TaxID=686309 RepID=UPI003D756C1D